MKKAELYSLTSRIADIQNRAKNLEDKVFQLQSDLSGELIPNVPELTEEATYYLSELSRALGAIAGEAEDLYEEADEAEAEYGEADWE